MRRIFLIGMPVLLTLTSCGDPQAPEDGVPVCEVGVELVVAFEAGEPEFAWSPDCYASSLTVEGEGVHWGVSAGANRLRSPVSYGAAPAETLTVGFAVPLESGATYTVRLERAAEPLGPVVVAEAVFSAP